MPASKYDFQFLGNVPTTLTVGAPGSWTGLEFAINYSI